MEAKEAKMFLPAKMLMYPPNPFYFLLQFSLQFNYLLFYLVKINTFALFL